MDGPEAASIREMGGKPVPSETVQDDHVMGIQLNLLPHGRRNLVRLVVHIQDAVRTVPVPGGDDRLHLRGQEEVP